MEAAPFFEKRRASALRTSFFLVTANARKPILAFLIILCLCPAGTTENPPAPHLELSRAVRSFEFLPVVGKRAALFGNETGNFEAWVYPLKIFRNFHVNVLTEGQTLPAETLARAVTVRPESATITYSGDTFSIRETLFVPVEEPGAIIRFEIETAQPLELEVVFERDFQLEWPAAIGGTYISWDPDQRAFYFGEEQKRYAAFIGSPTATDSRLEYFTNYSATRESSFRLGVSVKGKDNKMVVLAASMQSPADAENTYQRLVRSAADQQKISAQYYRDYLANTINLELPDTQLQQAYDWSRISMVQGTVANPFLGTGLIAGYRTSGDYERPGFAWFFGRDALWTSLALDAVGDFGTTRTALDFLSKYQRADGKIEHEISQSASLVDWFKSYPYAYASADATPLYIIALNDYLTHSGDVAFAKEKWESAWKAYEFLRSTYDQQQLAQNIGVGHGWIEGGPLLPLKQEFYQVGLAAEALQALSALAGVTGKNEISENLEREFSQQTTKLNQTFWSPQKNLFAYALSPEGQRLDVGSVLATVPMWFRLLENDKAEAMIDQLADYDYQADWGMRIISSREPRYDPGGYHFGAVWPLFTGWASVGEYRYHRALPAYSNLRANALLALDGSLGHVTEVLSGDYHQQLSTSSPHQIWSAAMVVSPILRGMLGLSSDSQSKKLTFAPDVPANWTDFRVHNIRIGDAIVDLTYRKTLERVSLEILNTGTGDISFEFSPALSLRAEVLGAELNGSRIAAKAESNTHDQHVMVGFRLPHGSSTLRIRTRNDFGLSISPGLPPLGSRSRGLRFTSETWSSRRDLLTIGLSGIAGTEYEVMVWNPKQIKSVEGATLAEERLQVKFPAGPEDSYAHSAVTIHFTGPSSGAH